MKPIKLFKNHLGTWKFKVPGPDGKKMTVSTKTKDRAAAEQFLKDSKAQELVYASQAECLTNNVVACLTSGGSKMTVLEAVDLWIDDKKYQGNSEATMIAARYWVSAFCEYWKCGEKGIRSIKDKDVYIFVNRDTKAKANSRRLMLAHLKVFFKFCKAKGLILADPAEHVRVNLANLAHSQKEVKPRPPFTDEEVDQMLAKLRPGSGDPRQNDFWYAAVAISRWTGLRFSDVCCLEWDSFAIPGRIIVWTIKRDKRIDVPLEPAQLKEACDSIARVDPVYCFPTHKNSWEIPQFKWSIEWEFRKLLIDCGINGKSFHCLRHSYIEDQFNKGVPMPEIAENVGHSSTRTTEAYLSVVPA